MCLTSRRKRSASPAASRVIGPRKMLILSGSTPLYELLLRGSGTPRYRPSSGCPSEGSSSTTISTLLIAARRSAGKELSASSIASSNGSLRSGPERTSISAMVPESVPGYRRLLLGALWHRSRHLQSDFGHWWPTENDWRQASGAFQRGVSLGRRSENTSEVWFGEELRTEIALLRGRRAEPDRPRKPSARIPTRIR